MFDVFGAAGAEVVEHQDFVAAGDQSIGKVRADEAAAACDQVPHAAPLPRPRPNETGPILQ